MRTRRLIGSLLVTALGATTLGAVATAAPASAATTVQTRIVSGSDGDPVISAYSKPVKYGDSISISVNVEGYIDGAWTQIYDGPVKVTQQVVGSKSASTVASSSSAYVYDSTPARGNATYRVTYGGGSGGFPEVNYAPTSATYHLTGVQRKLTYSEVAGNKTGIQGKMTPASKTKIVVLKKVGKKYRHFKTLRSSAKGKFKVVLPAPKRGKFHWQIIFQGNKTFAASVVKGSTYRG